MKAQEIKRRHVFYLSGYDPRGGRYYHGLYKEHAKLQSRLNGLDLDISPRSTPAPHITRWVATTPAGTVSTFDFLGWDDIIRADWRGGIIARLADMCRHLRYIVFGGVVAQVAKTHPMRLIAGLYPVAFLLIVLSLALGAVTMLSMAYGWAGAAAGVVIAALILIVGMRYGEKTAAFWLLRIYSFAVHYVRGDIKGLDQRLSDFAAHIIATIDRGDNDEIMIVGHSVGSILAVPTLARVLEKRPHAQVVLVTLGHCLPLTCYQPQAVDFRRDLACVASADHVTWVDYVAPRDGASFAMIDMSAASGLVPVKNLYMLSPRFPRLYTPETYKRLRYDWYKMHFLYLMSAERAGDYDYFALTAGDMSVVQRLGFAAQEAA